MGAMKLKDQQHAMVMMQRITFMMYVAILYSVEMIKLDMISILCASVNPAGRVRDTPVKPSHREGAACVASLPHR